MRKPDSRRRVSIVSAALSTGIAHWLPFGERATGREMTRSHMQDAKPWLTVIMPVYRGERWIEQSLQSLAGQCGSGVELIVIDSSPDNATTEIVRRFSDRLQLRLEAKSTLPSWQTKTNKAVEMASADHICWLHHDDMWIEGRTAAIRSWINAAPQAALHIAGSVVIDQAGRRLGVWRCPFGNDGPVDQATFVERMLVQTPSPRQHQSIGEMLGWPRAG